MSDDNERFAIIEVMGHQRIAGRVSEVVRYGVPMLQVDVPETEGRPAFSRRYAGGAIFSETDVPREIALAFVKREAPFFANPLALPAIRTVPPDAEEVSPECTDCGLVDCTCDDAVIDDDDGDPASWRSLARAVLPIRLGQMILTSATSGGS